MIFGYSLPEVRKAAVSAIYLAFVVVMMIGVVPAVGFEEACIAVVGPVIGLITVFYAKNHSEDDVRKALEQLWAAVYTALGFYVAVPVSTVNLVETFIAGVVLAVGVWWAKNEGNGSPGHGAPINSRGPPA